ncbi:MAG: biopolymer transporter ExbD [Proteobacteria bacterium]|nr:MAG: biopolymer transporter ExbD [Pseudomonadota bacterium]
MRRHFDSEESTGIDLAPMLDFVMNLLIFFIITAVFTKELGMPVGRHGGGTGGPATGEKEAGSISVVIKQGGEVMVDGRVVDVRAVRANVERLHAQKPDWGVMVTAEQNAETGVLVQVVDQVREGGVDNVSFGVSSR